MIVSLLVGLIQFEEVRVCAMTCKPGWSSFGGSCYKLYTSTKTWTDALKACQAEDSSLVDIASNDEQVFVYELSKGLQAWLGGSDASVEGHWLWYSSDQPWGYTHWDPRQPDDYRGNEDCLQFWNADFWDDYQCSGAPPMPYICEQRAGLSLCDSTWTYNDGHCYKLFKTQMRWSNAMETCQQNSASLVNIETPSEMTFVHGLSEGVAIWLGATDGPQEGNWAWTGTSAKWNYTNWRT
ncbi:C-type mannose receptor 2-like, partial [Saccostrea cucullata]|uniref:C-type mannose receptor 2-like n=1 Tax=Saccostrea cuccullata TaxID=36930 RepID=UPI002ED4DA13